MHNHAPPDYACPFCLLIQGIENNNTQLRQTDSIVRTAGATAFMATRKWPNHEGHVLVIPNEHFENIYDLPVSLLTEVHSLGKSIALAMKSVYRCDGVLFEQSNEPAGDQHIWHYHLHVIPRYQNDHFHDLQKEFFPPALRAEHARRLRDGLDKYDCAKYE